MRIKCKILEGLRKGGAEEKAHTRKGIRTSCSYSFPLYGEKNLSHSQRGFRREGKVGGTHPHVRRNQDTHAITQAPRTNPGGEGTYTWNEEGVWVGGETGSWTRGGGKDGRCV